MRRVYRRFRNPTLGLPPVTDVDASSSQLSPRKKFKSQPQISPVEPSSESRCIPSMRLPWKYRGDRVKEDSHPQLPARRTSRKLQKRKRGHQPVSRLPVRVVHVEDERPSSPFHTTETTVKDNQTEELQLLRKLSPIEEGDETTDGARSLRSITRSIRQPTPLYPPSSNIQLSNDHSTSQSLSPSTLLHNLTAHHTRSDSGSSDLHSESNDSTTGLTSSHPEPGRGNSTHRIRRKPVPRLPLPDDLISLIDVKIEEEIEAIEPPSSNHESCDIPFDTDILTTQTLTCIKRPYSPLFAPRSRTQSSPSFFSRITQLADKGPPICSRRFSYPPPIAKPSIPTRRTASVRLSPQDLVRINAEASTSSDDAETDLRPSVLDDFWYRLEGRHGGAKIRRQHEGRKPVPSLLRNSIVEDDSEDIVEETDPDDHPSHSISSIIRDLDKSADATHRDSWLDLPNPHPVQGHHECFASYASTSLPETALGVDDVRPQVQHIDHIEPPGIESSRFVEDFGEFSPTAVAVAIGQKPIYLNMEGSLSTLDLTGTSKENTKPVMDAPKCHEDDGDDEFDSLHRAMKKVERGLCQDIEWSNLGSSTDAANELSDAREDTQDGPDLSPGIPKISISPPSPPSPTLPPPLPPRSPLRHRRTLSSESDNETSELEMMRQKVIILERKFSEVKVALGVQQDVTVAVEREAQTVAVIVADLRKANEDKDKEITSLKAELAKLRRINSDFIRAVEEAGMANCALQDENDSLRIQRESYASMHGRSFEERIADNEKSVSPIASNASRSSTPAPPLMPSWTNVYKTPPRTPNKKLSVHVRLDSEGQDDGAFHSESKSRVHSERRAGYPPLTPEATPIRIRRRSASLDLRADAQYSEPKVRFAATRPDKSCRNNLDYSKYDDDDRTQ